MLSRSSLLVTCVIGLGLAGAIEAADCPRFRGPAGDGLFVEVGLLKQWPESGPDLLWSVQGLGKGYSSATVVDGTVYVTGMDDQQQGIIHTFNLDGSPKAQAVYGKEMATAGPAPGGTRGTPTIDGDRIFIVTGLGALVILDATSLEVLKTVDLVEQFDAAQAQFGYAESPLAVDQRVICTPGGPDAAMVALDRTTGQLLWQTKGLNEATGYCSARLVQHAGEPVILTMMAQGVIAVDPATGGLLWRHEYTHRAAVQPNPPLYADGDVFVCSGMGTGGALFAMSQDDPQADAKWTDRTLDCQMHGTVLLDGYIYGTAQSGNRGLVCLDWQTGQAKWNAGAIGQGALVAADGMLFIYGQDGKMHLVRASGESYQPAGTFTVPEGTAEHWAHPTIANGRLYIRHGDALMVYDIKA